MKKIIKISESQLKKIAWLLKEDNEKEITFDKFYTLMTEKGFIDKITNLVNIYLEKRGSRMDMYHYYASMLEEQVLKAQDVMIREFGMKNREKIYDYMDKLVNLIIKVESKNK